MVLGTRGSQLALAQSKQVAAWLREAHDIAVRLEVISTKGDRIQDKPLPEVGGKGLFTAELEAALLDGSIHLAVHSLKDLPTEDAEGLVVAAIPPREDPRDVLVGATLADLAAGAVVGTGSARRRTQILDARPDVTVEGIRGNVDTRLRKLSEGPYDAIVLAAAGLARLGIEVERTPLGIDQCVPAPGQGALGIQTAADGPARALIGVLDDDETRLCVEAERAFLAELGTGCSIPAGAYARLDGEKLWLRVMFADDAGTVHRASARGHWDEGVEMGAGLAEVLLA
ncbi:MAG: hydroxymethylbilane synthase [Proteobacteria bacterium]|nr:hydroxymethylbilane synthase [Pseudomonadota bacterium]MCP4918075.1 hydroxymethylbilane synthase [Pseudomonadota bacterium]